MELKIFVSIKKILESTANVTEVYSSNPNTSNI